MNSSPQAIKASEAAGQNSSLARYDGETPQNCVVCQHQIVDGHWFCRLPGEVPVLLCSPSCALRHFNKISVNANGAIRPLAESNKIYERH